MQSNEQTVDPLVHPLLELQSLQLPGQLSLIDSQLHVAVSSLYLLGELSYDFSVDERVQVTAQHVEYPPVT